MAPFFSSLAWVGFPPATQFPCDSVHLVSQVRAGAEGPKGGKPELGTILVQSNWLLGR